MKTKLCASIISAFCLSTASASAQEFPKSGQAEYDTYYVFENLSKIETSAGTGGIDEFTGITRNVKGDSLFNDMAVHCLGHWTVIGDKFDFRGSCAETDAAGDTVFTTFDNDNHYIVGGTGKYTGITGTVPYTAMQLADTVGGRTARVVNHKASWEIK
jgi:hypothetical protein